MTVKLSIVIPAFNEAALIARAAASAWGAGAQEVVVVDGGSDDGTADLAGQAGAMVLAAPRGRAAQQNVGAAATTGDVLLFLHADSALDPACGPQLAAALSRPEVQAGAFRQRIEAAGCKYRLVERGNALRVQWGARPYGDQAIFLRRTLFEAVGGFPDVPLLEDLLLARAVARHCRPVLLPGPVYLSPRHWARRGVVRQTLRNWSLLLAHARGVDPATLKRRYA